MHAVCICSDLVRSKGAARTRFAVVAVTLAAFASPGFVAAQSPDAGGARGGAGRIDAGALAHDAPSVDAGGLADGASRPDANEGGVGDAGPGDAGPAIAGDGGEPPDAASTVAPVAGPNDSTGPDAEATSLIIRTVLGLVVLVVLVWLASLPGVRRLEEMVGLSQVLTAGFAFVALGVVARHPAVGVLTDDILDDLTPVLHFALGWLGLVIGFQLDVRTLDRMPAGTALTVFVEAFAPFTVIAIAGALVMILFGEPFRDPLFLRHAIALGAAGAVSVTALRARPGPFQPDEPKELTLARIDSLDEIAGVVALAVIGAFFRPVWVHWRWELPGTVWLFVTLGMGAAVGLLVYAMVRERTTSAEFLAILVGSVALGSGMAGYVFLSPVVICFFAGAVLANFPHEGRERFGSILSMLERPVYYVLLTIAGALWDISDWRGWALVGVFLASRAGGTLAGRAFLDRAALSGTAIVETSRFVLRPISPVSIAIVVSLQAMYHGRPISWIVTAVIGAAIVTEVLLQIRDRSRTRRLA